VILYINGNKIQLENIKPIALTKQVNTIGSVSTRQNDYTQNLKAPLTSDNNRALDYLNAPGSNSLIPYQRNVAKLFSDTGDAIINKGFAIVKKTDNYYNITIYEGIISFWKKIENVSLKDIGLSSLNHIRNVASIKNSIDNDLDYRYLLADYNGKFLTDALNINADYLIPSSKISYLLQRIFDFANYTYSGAVFSTDSFLNRYISYPKSVGSSDQVATNVYTSNFINSSQLTGTSEDIDGENVTTYYNTLVPETFSNASLSSPSITVIEAGLYEFKIQGKIDFPVNDNVNYGVAYRYRDYEGGTLRSYNHFFLAENINAETELDLFFSLNLGVGDVVEISIMTDSFFRSYSYSFGSPDGLKRGVILGALTDLDINISKIEGASIDFEQAFVDLKCTDFLKEIMFQFSLTPFASRFSDEVLFLTEQERFLTNETLDWSDKFVSHESNQYEIGYAQKNNFKYTYNDAEDSHNDGSINVSNINLADEKTVIQSKTYSPEFNSTVFDSQNLLIVKNWTKELKDDSSINYKELKKRFHFLDEVDFAGSITIESEIFEDSDTVSNVKKASFLDLSYDSIISNYYLATRTILNNTRLESVVLKLNSNEATSLDLTKRYHFKQLGGDYVINRMINYVANKPTRFELLKINTQGILVNEEDIQGFLSIQITGFDLTACILTLDVDTDIVEPFDLEIRVVNTASDPNNPTQPLVHSYFNVTMTGGQVIFDLDNLEQIIANPFYRFSLRYNLTVFSNSTNIIDIGSCGLATAPEPTQTIEITRLEVVDYIVIQRVEFRVVRVQFSTNFSLPNDFTLTANNALNTDQVVEVLNGSTFVDVTLDHQEAFGVIIPWELSLEKDGVISNKLLSNG
jgi:hypothetical protein